MPDVIQQAFQNSPVLLQWFSWGVIVAFLITLVATVWIFADAQRTNRDATILKSVGAVACVLAVPALLARLHAGFAFEMKDSLALVAYLSAIAAAIAIVAVLVLPAWTERVPSTVTLALVAPP